MKIAIPPVSMPEYGITAGRQYKVEVRPFTNPQIGEEITSDKKEKIFITFNQSAHLGLRSWKVINQGARS